MRWIMIVLLAVLLSSCKHPEVGNKYRVMHQIDPDQGHSTIEYKNFTLDYDYHIVGDQMVVEGLLSCREDSGLGAWRMATITFEFMFQDESGEVLFVEQMSMQSNILCQDNTFKRSVPYKPEYKAVRVKLRYYTQS